MKSKILFIERKPHEFYSIERVFRQIARHLNKEIFEFSFLQMPFVSSVTGIFRNLASFRRPLADIYHITGDVHYISMLLPARKTVLTIHDLNILQTRKGWRKTILKKILLDIPVRKLKYITAISEATKAEILFHSRCHPDKIRVIENPVDESFFTDTDKIFDGECPNILQIGTAPHKNLDNLIKAVEGIRCRLTIIGKLGDEIKLSLNEKKIEFENRFDLTDAEIRQEYQKADIVAFCSLYEGFGLPVIEAQAARTPLITSDLEPLRSIAGNGAYLCDPQNFSSIRQGILKIINEPDFRAKIVTEGAKNVERFHPKIVAAKYESLYQEMLSARF